MKTDDFNFELPEELIARYPLQDRRNSRLLCLDHGQIVHVWFSQLPDLLQKNDVLIFNNTRVMRARLFGKKMTGGRVELLIEKILDGHSAYGHVGSNKSLTLPCEIELTNGIRATIVERQESLFKIFFHSKQTVSEILSEIGSLPLPLYMRREAEDIDEKSYQTVYAQKEGAVAAPTAGLHFDDLLFEELDRKGIKYAFLTLHIGAGTFKPVRVENIQDHHMHHEVFDIDSTVCDLIKETKRSGGRVIAVGTTVVRALETAAKNSSEQLSPSSGETNIFIYPGYRFQCVDGLITNFHLPKSTLLMLVCAFGGYHPVMRAYEMAIEKRYRFYSYGDAMLLLKNKTPLRENDEI